MMGNFDIALQKARKEFSRWFFISILSVFLVYILMFVISNLLGYKIFVVSLSFLLSLFLILSFASYVLLKSEFPFNKVFTVVLIIFFIVFTYLSLLLCQIAETIFISYLPIMSMFLMLTSFKKSVYFALLLVVFCFFLPKIGMMLNVSLQKDLYSQNKFGLKIQEYSVIVLSVYFTLLILYYYLKFFEIKKKHEFMESFAESKEENSETTSLDQNYAMVIDTQNDNRSNVLYQRIIQCFENDKPYKNPEFSTRILAELLDSNTTYISVALNKIGDKKFNQLVNEYRINQVKEELHLDKNRKFTIEYIYTNAGFSSQSIFNRIFKEQTGFTPSEYIENLSE